MCCGRSAFLDIRWLEDVVGLFTPLLGVKVMWEKYLLKVQQLRRLFMLCFN